MTMRKNYNFTRRKLYLPEYGRHIHQMVDTLLTIEDRQERTRQAKAVIAVMGNINPMLRDTEEFKHKLWDHLFIMSDFKLDVDSPYMQPSRQDLQIKPQKLPYPQSRVVFKHYGKHAQNLVRRVVEAQHTHNVTGQLLDIARFMRSKSYEYNHEHPNNDSIVRDIRIMSGGSVEVDLSEINNMRSEYRQHPQVQRGQKGKKPHQHQHPHQHGQHGQYPQQHAQQHPQQHGQQHSQHSQHGQQHASQQHPQQRKMQKAAPKGVARHSAHK